MTKIKKLVQIKKFNSFEEFEWDKISINDSFNYYNLIFGENGSGKSSIVQIFKTLNGSQVKKSQKNANIKIKTDSGDAELINSQWNSSSLNNKFIFFDSDYVKDNVHIHGKRDADLKKNSGSSFITITPEIAQISSRIGKLTEEFSLLENSNQKSLREKYKDYKPSQIDEEKLKNLKLEELNKKISKYEIYLIGLKDLTYELNFSDQTENFSNLLNFKPKQIQASKGFSSEDSIKLDEAKINAIKIQEIIEKIKNINDYSKLEKTDYAELAKNIQSLANITNLSIRELFIDKNDPEAILHKKDREGFKKLFDQLLNTDILLKFTTKYRDLIVFNTGTGSNIFTTVDALKVEYKTFFEEWDKLIDLDEKRIQQGLKLYKKILENLKNYQAEIIKLLDLSKKVEEKKIWFENLRKAKNDYESYILFKKNEDIIKDKRDKLKTEKENLEKQIDNFKSEIKLKFNENLEKLHFEYFLEGVDIPKNNIDLSQNPPIDFKFKHIFNNHELNIEKMSEGERQLIAFAYFLTELEIGKKYGNISDRILVFDDPITSLDEGNNYQISNQINLLANKKQFAQYFVFTHHSLFHKYLVKSQIWQKFGIIKNIIGGKSNSFIFVDCQIPILEKLKTVRENLDFHIKQTGDIETFAYQYSQLLRLAVEKLVKNYLLSGNSAIIKTKNGSKLEDKNFKIALEHKHQHLIYFFNTTNRNLDKLCEIYDWCNWANYLHEDKQDKDVLNSLLKCIEDFNQIITDFEVQQNTTIKI
jgi:energy-coupling factor transporter ATP-binding protein EcfA2